MSSSVEIRRFLSYCFAGDRAHDLSQSLAEEVKRLPNGKGLVFLPYDG